MKKLIFIVVGLLAAGVAYWLISPLFINKKVNEKAIEEPSARTVSSGKFSGLAGHNAEGTVSLVSSLGKYYVRFENDFKSTNGPDVNVYLGKNGKYEPATRLGLLKGNIGGQNYEIPVIINPSDYNEVWIWCRSFSVPFGKAELK